MYLYLYIYLLVCVCLLHPTHSLTQSNPPPKTKSSTGAIPEIPSWLADSLRQLRPLVETGYENVLLARLVMEQVRLGLCVCVGGGGRVCVWGVCMIYVYIYVCVWI